VTSDPDFKVKTIFEVEYLRKKLLEHTNRKLYLTYRMVPCLVTYKRVAQVNAVNKLSITVHCFLKIISYYRLKITF